MTGSCRGGWRPRAIPFKGTPCRVKASRSARPSPSAARGRRRGGATAPSRTGRGHPALRIRSNPRLAGSPANSGRERLRRPGCFRQCSCARPSEPEPGRSPSLVESRTWTTGARNPGDSGRRGLVMPPLIRVARDTPTRSPTNRELEQLPMRSTRHASRHCFAHREKIDLLQTIRAASFGRRSPSAIASIPMLL
jgi:hypothetical protein